MRRSGSALLADALAAAESIEEIVASASEREYLATRMLRSAVEREFLIIGEALNALDGIDPNARSRIAHLGRIVVLRSRLAHAYDLIDDVLVWSVACREVPLLLVQLRDWLEELR